MRDVLILPCETRVRELDAKLLLGCHAAERGYDVIVGWKRAIDLAARRLPRGIYVGKSVTDRNMLVYRMMLGLGHLLVAWDEEGLVYASTDVYHRTKVGARALNAPDLLFAWGEANADAWRSYPDYGGPPILATGNPRTDLLRPDLRGYFSEQADALRAAHGDFILVNTNFSRLNHYYAWQSRQRKLIEDGGGAITGESDPRLGWASHKAALFEAFLAMVPALAKRFPDTTLVVRPHPSENAQAWLDAAADCTNVRVVHEGNVAAWLTAARATIHNGCTTAVESFLLGNTALAYQPVTSKAYDHFLPNGLSIPAPDLATLGDRVADALAGHVPGRDEGLAQRLALARHHIASFEGPSACERILDGLESRRGHAAGALSPARRLSGALLAEGRAVLKRGAGLIPHNPNHSAYLRHMFPPLNVTDVDATVRRYGQLLGRFECVKAEAWGSNVFRLTAA